MLVLVTRQLSLYVFLIHFCIFMFILISCSGNLWLGVPLWTALLKVRYVKEVRVRVPPPPPKKNLVQFKNSDN